MKNRRLFTNIFYVVILLALAGFLVVEFTMSGNTSGKWLSAICLLLAVISVALVDIIFPVMDNRDMLKNKKYKTLITVKSLFFVASVAVLFLFEPFKVIKSTVVAVIAFVVLYFIQFFISLEPKVPKNDDTADEILRDDFPGEENELNIDEEIGSTDVEIQDDIEEENGEFTVDFGD